MKDALSPAAEPAPPSTNRSLTDRDLDLDDYDYEQATEILLWHWDRHHPDEPGAA